MSEEYHELKVGKTYIVKDYSTYTRTKREFKVLRVSPKTIKVIDKTNSNNLIPYIYEIKEFHNLFEIIDEYYEDNSGSNASGYDYIDNTKLLNNFTLNVDI